MRRAERGRSPWRDGLFTGASHLANRSLIWFAIAGLLAAADGERGRRAAGRGVAAIALASGIANGPAKLIVRRARPRRPAPLVRRPRTSSFPSGHTASAFAFAVAVSREMPPAAALLVPLAATVGYSRVYVGVHYPSDVLLGAVLGAATGLGAGRILDAVDPGISN
jgi:undecaprenyl-diphosphatase